MPNDAEERYLIEIANRQTILEIDCAEVDNAVRGILEEAGIHRATISVAVVDDPSIHEINRDFLNHDYPTDVVSFPLEWAEDYLEGEVVVSAETALLRAPEFGWRPSDELILYVVHGMLHLVGYDDHDNDDRQEMRSRERQHMQRLGRHVPEDAPHE